MTRTSGRDAQTDRVLRNLRMQLAEAELRATAATRERDEARDALARDRTGLAAALGEVVRVCDAYQWATEGRGCYEWDDERYRGVLADALSEVRAPAIAALRESGSRVSEVIAPRSSLQSAPLRLPPRARMPESVYASRSLLDDLAQCFLAVCETRAALSTAWMSLTEDERVRYEAVLSYAAKGALEDADPSFGIESVTNDVVLVMMSAIMDRSARLSEAWEAYRPEDRDDIFGDWETLVAERLIREAFGGHEQGRGA